MAKRMPSYFPQGARLYVRNGTLVHGVDSDGCTYAELGAPTATGGAVMTAQSINTTSAITTMDAAYLGAESQMSRFGRGLSLVASGATSVVVAVKGRDYLGQYMREDVTLNGTTPVATKKAFRYVDNVTPLTAAAVTLTVTTVNLFGLPYKILAMDQEIKNQAAAANAGTVVAGLATSTTSTGTTNDVRGTYVPATVLPDGTNTFAMRFFVDNNNFHGNAQYYA